MTGLYRPCHREALAALAGDRLDEAEAHCGELLKRSGEDGIAWFIYGAIASRRRRGHEAVQRLERAAELAGSDQKLLGEIVKALFNMRALDRARPILEHRMDLSDPAMMLALARCVWNDGEYIRSLHMTGELNRILPEAPSIASYHARALVHLDRHAEAAAVLDRVLARHPEQRDLVAQRLRIELSLAGIDAARKLVQPRPGAVDELACLEHALESVAGSTLSVPAKMPDDWGEIWQGFELLFDLAPQHWTGDTVAVLRQAAASAPSGVFVECGVYHGLSINLLAGWAPRRQIHGFDSFQGLSSEWEDKPAGSYSTGGRLPEVAANVELHPGWFDRTLPDFAESLEQPVALVHVDCDTYEGTRDTLAALGPVLAPGAVVVFDEFVGYTGWEKHESRAWREYLAQSGRQTEALSAVLLGPKYAVRVLD